MIDLEDSLAADEVTRLSKLQLSLLVQVTDRIQRWLTCFCRGFIEKGSISHVSIKHCLDGVSHMLAAQSLSRDFCELRVT